MYSFLCLRIGCPVDGLCSSLSHSISLACSTIVNGCTAAIGWVYHRVCGCGSSSGSSSSGMGNQYESIPLVDIEQRRTNIERSSSVREDANTADSSTSNTSTTTTAGASNKPVKYYRSVHRSNATSGGQPAPSGSATTTTGSGKVIML